MGDVTVIQFSDPHLSRTHGFFNANWRRLMSRLQSATPALVVVSGDLTVDGADSADDLTWAAAELARIRVSPWVCIPGNHDIGEESVAAAQGHGQTIDAARRERWIDQFGHDCWVREVGTWRLIGLNSQLFGSGLDAEAAQWAWLEATLAAAVHQPAGVFLHKPLFLEAPGEPDMPGHATLGTPRERLLALLQRSAVRFVASGHLHQYRARRVDGIEHVWAPSTAFLIGEPLRAAVSRLGYVAFTLREDGSWSHELVTPAELMAIDLDALKGGEFAYLRDIPGAAVPELMKRCGIPAVV